MPTLTINITGELNNSLQKGDDIYNAVLSSTGGFNTSSSILHLGKANTLTSSTTSTINLDLSASNPQSIISNPSFDNHFVFFAKDNKVNTSGIIGSYAEVKFVNNSTDEAKLFVVNSEIVNS